jgi:hypothetical protein
MDNPGKCVIILAVLITVMCLLKIYYIDLGKCSCAKAGECSCSYAALENSGKMIEVAGIAVVLIGVLVFYV